MFGDKRLETRFEKILTTISSKVGQKIPSSQPDWASTKGVYRFWDNASIHSEDLLRHKNSDLMRQLGNANNGPVRVLQLCDSTELNYTRHRCAKSLGPLSYLKQRGLLLFNSLLINSLGCPLGLYKQSFHIRTDESFGSRTPEICNSLSCQEKQTQHWLEHFDQGQSLCVDNQAIEVVFVADRGADVMDLLARRAQPNMHFLVRSKHNRKLSDGRSNLIPTVDSWSVAGNYTARVIHSKTRQIRTAQLEVRYGQTEIKLHKGLALRKQLPAVKVSVVDVREKCSNGIDKEEVIHWRLVTSLPINTFNDAKEVIQYYLWRWLIERFHFLLKSGGAKVEHLQLATPHRLKNAITTFSIALMDVFELRYLAENNPKIGIYEAGISELEHKVLYTYLSKHGRSNVNFDPENPPNIQQYCIELGKIGGFFPSKRQLIPGLAILTRAREKLDLLIDAFITFQ